MLDRAHKNILKLETQIQYTIMAPTEASILSHLLLPPAHLPTMISRSRFAAFFPPTARSNPQIASLYRDLQYQRAQDIDHVTGNITAESKRGETQMRDVARTRRRDERGDGLDGEDGFAIEIQMEEVV